jgi:sporulation protein YlmC with PRC-barrel domain
LPANSSSTRTANTEWLLQYHAVAVLLRPSTGAWLAVMLVFTTSPTLPEAGVSLFQVDLSVVGQGDRVSKLLGSGVVNDKSEKIGTLDDVISDKKHLNFAILHLGGFLGLGGRLVAVPYENLVSDDKGQKITLPSASKEALKNLAEFHYTS